MSKLKIAILLSGQPRFIYSLSYKTIKEKLIDKYDCDFYCHCWFSEEAMQTAPWASIQNFKCTGKELELIKVLYNPIGFEYDDPLKPEEIYNFKSQTSSPSTPYNLSSMYKSMKRSYEIFDKTKPKDIKYDIFIRLRYDAILDILPEFELLKKNYLYFANHHGDNALANNMIISTDENSFRELMCIYDKMQEFDNEFIYLNDEEYIAYLIHKYKLKYKLVSLNIFYPKLPQDFDNKIAI